MLNDEVCASGLSVGQTEQIWLGGKRQSDESVRPSPGKHFANLGHLVSHTDQNGEMSNVEDSQLSWS